MSDDEFDSLTPEDFATMDAMVVKAEADALTRSSLAEGGPASRTRSAGNRRTSKTPSDTTRTRTKGKGRKRQTTPEPELPPPRKQRKTRTRTEISEEADTTQGQVDEGASTPVRAKPEATEAKARPTPQATPSDSDSSSLPKPANSSPISINRAPVLALWSSIVAEREGFDRKTALTVGKAVMTLCAQSKGKSIGVFHSSEHDSSKKPKASDHIDAFGMHLPAKETANGLRACLSGSPLDPLDSEWYVRGKFGARYDDARRGMAILADKFSPEEIGGKAYKLYESFRPSVAGGAAGWGSSGKLDVNAVMSMGP
ncbi:hypothetical protein HKX48_004977 [Thoreauomyces humboldtii]|nr:hypothetical protein HKX48_004977 [Thoreauomyces humboldtii]